MREVATVGLIAAAIILYFYFATKGLNIWP